MKLARLKPLGEEFVVGAPFLRGRDSCGAGRFARPFYHPESDNLSIGGSQGDWRLARASADGLLRAAWFASWLADGGHRFGGALRPSAHA